MSCLIREPSLVCCFSILLESLGLVIEPLNGPAKLFAIAMDRQDLLHAAFHAAEATLARPWKLEVSPRRFQTS